LISIIQLGTIDYATGLRLQQRLVELRKESRIGDVLLLLEHSPVITLGRNANAANILAPPELLAQRGVEVFECDRGGDVTFHGPGQLVGYPILDLRGFLSEDGKRKTLGAVEFVRHLEEVLICTCSEFGIPTMRIPGLTGVWTDLNPLSSRTRREDPIADRPPESRDLEFSRESKIAAIGVHISRGVTSHGFAINVDTDLSFFDLIIPCGITAKPVSSMAKQLNKLIPLQDVAHSVSRHFGAVFGSQILWLATLDALLNETVGVPLKTPSELRKLHKEEDTFWA
jgi:lipoyl(octanoyl) transferase